MLPDFLNNVEAALQNIRHNQGWWCQVVASWRGLSELRDWREIDYCAILARYFLCLSYSAGSSTFRLSFLFSSLSLCNFMWCLWSIAFSFLPLGTIHPPRDVRLCSYFYKNCACFAVVKTDSALRGLREVGSSRARSARYLNAGLYRMSWFLSIA